MESPNTLSRVQAVTNIWAVQSFSGCGCVPDPKEESVDFASAELLVLKMLVLRFFV
jgi:hypothetical protein